MCLYTEVHSHDVGLLAFGPNLFFVWILVASCEARLAIMWSHILSSEVRRSVTLSAIVMVTGFMGCAVVTCMLV